MDPNAEPNVPQADQLEVAVVQLSSGDDLARNLETCQKLVLAAAQRGARLALLPENFAYFGPEAGKLAHAERIPDPGAVIQRMLLETAERAGITIVAGGMPEISPEADRPYNAALVVGPGKQLLGAYRKIHMFDVDLTDGTSLRESAGAMPGSEPVVVKLAGFECGLSICYDLRFPELYRALVAKGAELLLVPAAFTLHTGKDHWHVLLRARAIESQCYVAAAAQWGSHPQGRKTYGHSLIADPWGTVIAECSDGIGFTIGTIDRARLREVRAALPALAHRKIGRES